MESILTSVKKLLGIEAEDTSFDVDIIIHINSALMVLNQLGAGPVAGLSIKDASTTWAEFLPENSNSLEAVKSYVFLKVKILFDPPLSSAAMNAMNKLIDEFEWRITAAAETSTT